MAHSTQALTKAGSEIAVQSQTQGSFFKKSEGTGGSFRDSLKAARAEATNQTQQTNKAAEADLSKKDAKELYRQFFEVSMFRLLPLTTPDRYESEE